MVFIFKNVKHILIWIGIIIAAFIGLAVYFVVGSLPDKNEIYLMKKHASQYLKNNPK
jgi:hypothetical protein